MGTHSACYTAAAFVFLAAALVLAYQMHGAAPVFIGGFGFCSALLAAAGIWTGVKGLKERDRIYRNCKAGIAGGIILLLALAAIFICGNML